jgi:hypothetical protein
MPKRSNNHYGYGNTLSFFGDSIRAAGLELFTRAAGVMVPFIMWPIMAILGFVFNWQWHGSLYVLGFIPVAAICLSVLVFILPPFGFNSTFWHSTLTVGPFAFLLFMITLVGWTHFNLFTMVAVVPLICLSWSIRISIENNRGKGLEDIFAQAGMPGANMKVHKKKD